MLNRIHTIHSYDGGFMIYSSSLCNEIEFMEDNTIISG